MSFSSFKNKDSDNSMKFDRIPVQSDTYKINQADRYRHWLFLNPIYKTSIDVTGQCYRVSDLPYQQELIISNPDFEFMRDRCSRIFLRGDDRNIEEIKESGGFHPNSTRENKSSPLDLYSHKFKSTGSGFVSFTTEPNVAHLFGNRFANYNKNKKYTLYAAWAVGAVVTSSVKQVIEHELPNIDEYDVPGGIDKENIVAYRECEQIKMVQHPITGNWSYLTKCGHVFFNQKHKPDSRIVDALLFDGETLGEDEEKSKGLKK